MFRILFAYLFWIPALVGLGSVPFRRVSQELEIAERLALEGVFGLIVLGVLGAVIHLFLPISPLLSLSFGLLGWLSFIRHYNGFFRSARIRDIGIGLGLLLAFALSSTRELEDYDTGLYYLQTVQWNTQSAMPWGLANLHLRFGFNSLWYMTASFLEAPFFVGKSSFFVSGILVSLFSLFVWHASNTLKVSKTIRFSTFYIFTSMFMLLKWGGSSSMSTMAADLAVTFFTILFFFYFLKTLEAKRVTIDFWIALVFALFSTTIKISAIFLPVSSLVALYNHRITPVKNQTWKVFLIGSLILLPWLVRGFFLSGCLLFPLPQSCIPYVPWSVPVGLAKSIADVIVSMAKAPALSRTPSFRPDVVLNNWNWLKPWAKQFFTSTTMLAYECWILISLGLIVVRRVYKNNSTFRDEFSQNPFLFILPLVTAIGGVVFWFVTAPDMRFGEGVLFSASALILTASASPYFGKIKPVQVAKYFNTLSLALIFGFVGFFGRDLSSEKLFQWPKQPRKDLRVVVTDSGFHYFIPERTWVTDHQSDLLQAGQCWDAPLPCGPALERWLATMQKDGQYEMFFKPK